MRLVWSAVADRDMENIQRYLHERNPDASWGVVENILKSASLLSDTPKMGKQEHIKDEYEKVVPDENYTIFYRLNEKRGLVIIDRVLHQSRLIPDYIDHDKSSWLLM